MRNINRLSPKIYLWLSVIADLVAMIIYRATLFQCLFLSTFNESRVVLWIIWGVSVTVTFLLTYERRRNYLSVVTNAVFPFGIYSLMAYENSYLPICAFVEMTIILLGGIYCFAVYIRPIKTDDFQKCVLILKSRVKSSIVGLKTIAAVCFSVMLIYISIGYAFDVPSFIPAVKPSVSVAEDKAEILEENLPVISKIDDDIWKKLSFEDRLDVLQTLANVDASQQGISHEINVCSEYLGSYTYGTYDYSTHTVTISSDVIEMDTATESVKTLCHEVRHAYQHDVANAFISLDKDYQQLLIFDDVRKYYENIEDYQTAEKDGFDEYENQTIEVDSREYSEQKASFYFWAADKYLADAS